MQGFIGFAAHALNKLSQRPHIFVDPLFLFVCCDFYRLYLPFKHLFLQLCSQFLPDVLLDLRETLTHINLESELDEIIFSLLDVCVDPHNLRLLRKVHTLVLKFLEFGKEDVVLEPLLNHV